MKTLVKLSDDWFQVNAEDKIPLIEPVKKVLEAQDAFRSGYGQVVAYFFDSKSPRWIVVMDDGGYYKVDAKYIVWTHDGKSQAIWSDKALKTTLKSLMETGKTTSDPDYQT